jgi:hypothetical protein
MKTEKNTDRNGIMDKVLRLYKGEAHKIRVEDAKEITNSYFLEAYRQAFSCFSDIHEDNKITRDSKREFNNVIAFCGERGSGKTSAMMSFRNVLGAWEKERSTVETLLPKDHKFNNSLQFICLDAVDPSRFEPNDRLSGTVLSELYRRYAEKVEKNKRERHEHLDVQRKLEQSFVGLLRGIQLLSARDQSPFGDPRSADSEFEVLKGIAGAAGLRKTFHELVENYLRYELNLGVDGDLANSYLVIPVDDLDLSVEHAFNLAEDIRKYMHVPNVIILIAMKLDQLRLAVEQANYSRFKTIRKQSDRPDNRYVEDMSNMYLEKLIPISRRILLPVFGNFENAKSQQIFYDWKEAWKDDVTHPYVENLVLSKIKAKTFLDFKTKNATLHPLVPQTLRELQNLLELLDDLDPPKFDQNPNTISAPGLEQFKAYFFEFWVSNALTREEEEALLSIKNADYSSKNSIAVHHLGTVVKNLRKDYSKILTSLGSGGGKEEPLDKGIDYQSDINRILSAETQRYNISLGDVLLLITEVERLDRGQGHGKFLFAIQAYYSMEMVRLIISRSNSTIGQGGKSDLGELIGGALFHPKQFSIIPEPSRQTNKYVFVPQAVNRHEIDAYLSKKNEYGFNDRILIDKRLTQDANEPTRNLLQFILKTIDPTKREPGKLHPIFIDTQKIIPFAAFASMLYLGEQAYLPTYRTLNYRWYLQTSNLVGDGRIPIHFAIDYKAILFWNLLPELNIYRIYGSSRDKFLEESDYLEGGDINTKMSNEEENQVEATQSTLISEYYKNFGWVNAIRVFQIDILNSLCKRIEILIDRDLKQRSLRSFAKDLERVIDAYATSISELLPQEAENTEESGEKKSKTNLDLAGELFPWFFRSRTEMLNCASQIDESYFLGKDEPMGGLSPKLRKSIEGMISRIPNLSIQESNDACEEFLKSILSTENKKTLNSFKIRDLTKNLTEMRKENAELKSFPLETSGQRIDKEGKIRTTLLKYLHEILKADTPEE